MHVYFVKHYFWLKYEVQFKLQQDSSSAINLRSLGKVDESKYSLGGKYRTDISLNKERNRKEERTDRFTVQLRSSREF